MLAQGLAPAAPTDGSRPCFNSFSHPLRSPAEPPVRFQPVPPTRCQGSTLCGTILLEKAGIVQSAQINNLPLGRNVDEALRLVDARQFHEAHGEVCPANWQKA